MNTIHNKEIIIDLIEKHAKNFKVLELGAFKESVYDPGEQDWAAEVVDEARHLGIYFNDLSRVMNEMNSAWGSEQLKRLRILACLHPDPNQAKRLSDFSKEATPFALMYGVKLDINRINFGAIKDNETALKDASHLFDLSNDVWVAYLISSDDAGLFYTRTIETSALQLKDVENKLQENPNIRKFLYGTDKYKLKDLANACALPFQSDFNINEFDIDRVFNSSITRDLLARHGEMILAGCFRHAYAPKRIGAALNVKEGQQEAILSVLQCFISAGVDWYKPWCASRLEMYPMALMDIQEDRFTAKEIARSFVLDNRNFQIPHGSIKEACRRALIQLMPPKAFIAIYKEEDTRDEMMDFFYRETGNQEYLDQIKDPSSKRDILSDELGM